LSYSNVCVVDAARRAPAIAAQTQSKRCASEEAANDGLVRKPMLATQHVLPGIQQLRCATLRRIGFGLHALIMGRSETTGTNHGRQQTTVVQSLGALALLAIHCAAAHRGRRRAARA
jgi:hypothetical protein